MSALGEFDREIRLARVDRRSRGGRLVSHIERQLTEQLGHPPAPAERMLIQRCALLQLQLAVLDRDILRQRRLSSQAIDEYMKCNEQLRRTLVALNMVFRADGKLTQRQRRKPSFVEQALADYEASLA